LKLVISHENGDSIKLELSEEQAEVFARIHESGFDEYITLSTDQLTVVTKYDTSF